MLTMHPHPYTVDSLSKSQELASAIFSSSTPAQISSVCSSIASFLQTHTPDQSRHFFSLTFPTLICKLYGFGDGASPPNETQLASSNGGWIDIILQSKDSDLASRVFSLLSPNGVIFQSIYAVDRQSLVKYVFPVERLPEWARFMLSSERDCQVLNNLCPLFRGKIKEDSIKGSLYYQVQLNVFEYFMFWFAYYPICKGNSENPNNKPTKRTRKLKLENWIWTSSIPGFSHSKRGNEQEFEHNLYVRLLCAYLLAFVPIRDLESHQPYRNSLLHYGRGNDGSILLRAEFFVDTLVHYWLVDNDFSPLPVNVCKSFGLSFSLKSVLGENPPTPNLGEIVKLLVKHLNLSATVVKDSPAQAESPKWRSSVGSFDLKSREFAASLNDSMHVGASWNLWIQRPVYRFVLRTFLFCPVGTSIKNASQVFLVWISFLEPWKVGLGDFLELDAIADGLGKDLKKENERSREGGYSALWQDYVLSNYLYYSSLVMHFIGFAHKFLHTDPELIVQMVLQVMKILTSSKELTDLVKKMDAVFHSKQAGSGKLMLNSLYRYVPLIREHLQDWEDGLCESDADGSFLHEHWNKDLRLFSDGEDGGQQLLQLFILRAEAELQANSGDNLAHNLQLVDSLKAQVSCLFGGYTVKPISFTPETKQPEQSRDEIFKPRRVANRALADVKYRGDRMKRPISDDEVAWLANLLVWLSIWLNENLGLNQEDNNDGGPKWSYVEVSSEVENVCGPSESMKMMFFAISSWFLALCGSAVRLMRKHGVRINLRILASKKVVMVLFMSALFSVLKKAFGFQI
uniref:Sphingomyelin phosphodiesterase 4 n=1 Tax=Manihot esculenta TaxID=3983 RepID=A0A2C9WD28_MANES